MLNLSTRIDTLRRVIRDWRCTLCEVERTGVYDGRHVTRSWLERERIGLMNAEQTLREWEETSRSKRESACS